MLSAELGELGKAEAWVGRNALKELERLVSVPERRRLVADTSKTARKRN